MDYSTEDMHGLERAWLRDRATSKEILDDHVRSTYGYALRLATLKSMPGSDGQSIPVSSVLDDFRHELMEIMCRQAVQKPFFSTEAANGTGTLAWTGKWRRSDIVENYPQIADLLHKAVTQVLSRYPEIQRSSLENILRQKRLVLALGGGGGTGYVHLCLFQWLEELNLTPALITGTSIGSLLGFLRAMQTSYDAAMTMLKLPGLWRLTRSIHPSFDIGDHGLMGMWHLDFNYVVEGMIQSLGYQTTPLFRELKIPFACVSTGIIRRDDITMSVEYQPDSHSILSRLSRLSWKNALAHGAQIASLVTSSHATREVVFGLDDLTATMPVTDAVAFSSLIPGLLHYKIPRNHYRSHEILNTIFKRDNIYRLTDGGLVSNVPVRAAVRAIESGKYGHENVYILGLDVFAPQARDGIFYLLEQIANTNANTDARYADAFFRPKDLLSPANMAPTLTHLRWLNLRFRKTFQDEMRILEYAMTPLKPFDTLKGF